MAESESGRALIGPARYRRPTRNLFPRLLASRSAAMASECPAPGHVRYTVVATLAGPEVLEEFTSWLSDGHIKVIIDEGGALSGEFAVIQDETGVRVASSYIFPSREAYENYTTGLALTLKRDGVVRFVETQKVLRFDRTVGEIGYVYHK